jgi:hypothetical protein
MQPNNFLQRRRVSGDDKAVMWCVLCSGCSLVFTMIGIMIAYTITGILFMLYDWGKGGECADSKQVKSIYVYCCFSIFWVVRFAAPVLFLRSVVETDKSENTLTENMTIAGLSTSVVVIILSLPFAVTGCIILLLPSPCEQFRNMAIYKWACWTLYFDMAQVVVAIANIIVSCCYLKKSLENDSNLPTFQQPLVNSGTAANCAGSGVDIRVYSICNHFDSSFHVYYATEPEATRIYHSLWGSKLMGTNGHEFAIRASSPMWETTLREYWSKVEEKRKLLTNRGSQVINVPSDFGWSVCTHGPSFYILFFSAEDEAAARHCYNNSSWLSTRLLARGDTIVDKWAMTNSWEKTIFQYWQISVEVAVLKLSLSHA